MPQTIKSRAALPGWARQLFEHHRFKILFGGRGSAKSWTVARILLIAAVKRSLRILCTREIQKSLQDSVHLLLKIQIQKLGYSELFTDTRSSIRCVNGSEFIFEGLRHNIDNIRSKEAIDIVWVEEAQAVSQHSWDVLIPTTIRKKDSEIWAVFNPELPTDPVYSMFVGDPEDEEHEPPPDTLALEVNWGQNRWFPEGLREHKDFLYEHDPESAEWIYGGGLRKRSKAEILGGIWCVEDFEPNPKTWGGPYYGVDWGFSQHPSVMVRCWITGDPKQLEQELWIDHEAWGVGVTNDELPEFFDSVPGGRKHVSRADNSRPETINHLRTHGYPEMIAAPKWAGSVEDGIEHLRGYKRVVIHPRCKHTRSDFLSYKFKVDAHTGDVLPIIIKLHDDVPDALRYALAPLIKVPQRPVVEVLDP